VLRACYDLLKPGGRIVLTSIFVAPDATEAQYRRAIAARGRGSGSRREITGLLTAAGFEGVHARDVSRAFARSSRAFYETASRYAEELRESWGTETFEDRLGSGRATLELIEEGVLKRGLFWARKPGRVSSSKGARPRDAAPRGSRGGRR